MDIERQVTSGINRYARALDGRDWSLLDQVFAVDAVASFGSDPLRRGRAAIVAAVRSYLDDCGPSQHMVGNIEVEQRGDGIYSRSYVRAVHRARTHDALLWSFGEYVAQWGQENGRLLVTHWEMRVAFNHGDPNVFGQ